MILPSMRFVCAVVETVARRDGAEDAVLNYSATRGGDSKPVLFPQLATALSKYAQGSLEEDVTVTDSLAFDRLFQLSPENLAMLKGKRYDCLAFSSAPGPSAPSTRRISDIHLGNLD